VEAILLGIYAFLVWLIFIKLKWLPWTTPWKVGVVIFPVVAIAILLLLLNIVAPTTSDVRVVNYVVPIVSQVRGRVIEVPVENNRPVKKGDVLFKVDPTPYENEVHSLEAKLISDEAKVGADRQRLSETQARLADAQQSEPQLKEQLNQATGQVGVLLASLDLAKMRVAQNTELVKTGAGNRFDLEQAETNVKELTAQIASARAAEQEVREKLQGRVKGELASVAEVRAQIATAQAQL
jgi:multidrug resistance efflux pump